MQTASIVTAVAVWTLHRVLCLPTVVAAASSPPTGRVVALVRRGNYSTIVLDVWERLGGNGGAGGHGESHIPAYLRSTCQPLSAVPTPWERLRAVIEPGGGRPPRDSPLGGGRAPLEGAQRRVGLELCAYWPRSHELPASRASMRLPRRCHSSRAQRPQQQRLRPQLPIGCCRHREVTSLHLRAPGGHQRRVRA